MYFKTFIIKTVTTAPNTTVSDVTAAPAPFGSEPGWGLNSIETDHRDRMIDFQMYRDLNKFKDTNPGLSESTYIFLKADKAGSPGSLSDLQHLMKSGSTA